MDKIIEEKINLNLIIFIMGILKLDKNVIIIAIKITSQKEHNRSKYEIEICTENTDEFAIC